MSETTPETTRPAGHMRGRRPFLAFLGAVVSVAGSVHGFGGGTVGTVAAAGGATAAGGVGLWKYPHIRRHFAGSGRARRSAKSSRTRTVRTSGGGGKRSTGPGRKGMRAGAGGGSRRKAGLGTGRGLAGRRSGAGRSGGRAGPMGRKSTGHWPQGHRHWP